MSYSPGPDEKVSRCVMLEAWDDDEFQGPEGSMFMPDLVKGRYETSVIMHEGQTDADLDAIGQYIHDHRSSHPEFIGRAICSRRDIEEINTLKIEPKPGKCSKFHANIIGWGNDVALRMLQAERIAKKSVFVRRVA